MFVLLLSLQGLGAPAERPPDASTLVGRSVGLGLVPGPRGDIVQVAEDAPAWAMGIRPEHRLVRIDGRSTRRMSAEEATGRLAVAPGVSVQLVVLAGGEEQVVEVTASEFDGFNRTLFTESSTIDAELWCEDGDCSGGVGRARHTTGFRYVGPFREGLYHGYGVFDVRPGERYEGGFQEGLRHGPGVLTIKDEARFAGEWEQGVADGTFSVRWDNGDTYEGNLRALVPHGTGVRVWNDGRAYKGAFDYGEFHGQGGLTLPDGQQYDGSFQNGLAHGRGKLVMKRGDVLEGTFLKGKMTGTGTRTWTDNGRVYEGEVANNEPHGQGLMTWTDGSTHGGTFAAGEIVGLGTKTLANGTVLTGEWTDEHRVLGTLTDRTGTVTHQGWLVRGKPQGWGRAFKRDGTPKRARWWFNGRHTGQHPRSKDVGRDEQESYDQVNWAVPSAN